MPPLRGWSQARGPAFDLAATSNTIGALPSTSLRAGSSRSLLRAGVSNVRIKNPELLWKQHRFSPFENREGWAADLGWRSGVFVMSS